MGSPKQHHCNAIDKSDITIVLVLIIWTQVLCNRQASESYRAVFQILNSSDEIPYLLSYSDTRYYCIFSAIMY